MGQAAASWTPYHWLSRNGKDRNYMIDYYGEFEGLWGTCSIIEDGVRTTKYYNWVLFEILLQKIFFYIDIGPRYP